MIILHIGECAGSLFLWGETSGTGENTVQSGTGTGDPLPYPFAASSKELSHTLKDAVPDFALAASRKCAIIAWLPTTKTGPVPSSDILAEMPASNGRTKLAPWTIPAYKLAIPDAIDLLCESVNKRTLAEGVLVGADMAYWAEAMRLVGSMVARQQFLPDLTVSEDKYRAVWNPVFVGKDAERFSRLAKHMPAAGRALSESSDAPPVRPAIPQLWHV